jgi:predicted amidohydrolase
MVSSPAALEANLIKISELALEAAAQGAQLALFPECALTGYALTTQEVESVAEPIPGPSTLELQRICKRSGLFLVIGGIERDPWGGFFNSAVLIGPDGLMGSYRKTHLPFLGVDRYLAAGDRLIEPISTPFADVGMLICYDFRFPEPIRILALNGAQVILLPTAWPASASLYPDFMARTRAAENRVYVLAANHVGKERDLEFLGRSVIVAPDGTILAEASAKEEGILIADIDPSSSDGKKLINLPGKYELDLFQDRRPELYHVLCKEGKAG